MHFISGEYQGQVWTFKNLNYAHVVAHYERLPKDYYNQVIVYVRTGHGRYFIKDFIVEYDRIKMLDIKN